jgi:hypothetical protein
MRQIEFFFRLLDFSTVGVIAADVDGSGGAIFGIIYLAFE